MMIQLILTFLFLSQIYQLLNNNQTIINRQQQSMNFLDKDFQNLQQQSQCYQNDYESGFHPISRRITFSHSLDYLIHLKKQIELNKQRGKQGLTDDQFKTIREIDTSIYLGKAIAQYYIELKKQKGEEQPFDGDDIFKLVRLTFSSDLWLVILLFGFEAIFRLIFSIFLIYLFETVMQGDLSKGYIYSVLLLLIWYTSQIFRQNAWTDASILSTRIKAALSMLLYSKISKLTLYVMKSSQIGKITNLLSNDLGVIGLRLSAFLNALIFPIVIIGSTTLLIIRLGWPGVLGTTIVLLIIPIFNFISKINGKILQEINVHKDKRIKATAQIIQGIKYIKLYGWEFAFRRIIQNLRELEILNYKRLSWDRSIQRAIGNSIGYCAVIVMFIAVHYSFSKQLTIPLIFSTLQITIGLRIIMRNILFGFNFYYEIRQVFTRFASIFNIKNTTMIQIDQKSKKPLPLQNQEKINAGDKLIREDVQPSLVRPGEIIFKNFNGYWEKDLTVPSLKNINLQFRRCTYYGITGQVGSGKSGLLGAILSQIPYYSGSLVIGGSISYVEQQPVIFSMNIKDNILFGKPFDQTMYNYVLHVSCLQSDLEILDAGDQTMVGEKGITLSGGQKARLALARAVYADADIYIFDDPISAVDAKVARQINQRCLKVLSKRKTVILVTHQIGFLYDCDQVIILENGAVKNKGSPTLLTKQLQQMSHSFKVKTDPGEIEMQLSLSKQQFPHNDDELSVQSQEQVNLKIKPLFKEQRATVTFSSYIKFFFASQQNYCMLPITIILFLMSELITTLIFRFLAMYMFIKNGLPNIFGQNFTLYWSILGLLVIVGFGLLVIKYYCLTISILKSNEKIHEKMINGIVRSPSQFFDVTPSGVLLNKFSSDLGILDNSLSLTFMDMLQGPVATMVAFINICIIDVFFLIPVCIFIPIIIAFFIYSRPVIVDCKQKQLKNRSPMFNSFSQTISGLIQIRTFGRRMDLIYQFAQRVNKSSIAVISFDIVNRGFAAYVTLGGNILMLVGMELGVWKSTPLNAGLYAVTVIFSIQFSQFMSTFLRQAIAVQGLIISSERAFHIIDLPPEKELRTDYDNQIGLEKEVDAARNNENFHQQWPKRPSIEFTNLSAKYRDDLPLILNNIGFTVNAGEKIGIVGRTGAGKSSIIQTIFRIIEPEIGSVYSLGGYNALKMGLHSLRQHISVIPQTPFLFKGTIKQNIDPFSNSNDEDVWNALEQSGLRKHVESLPNQLQTDISNSSQSFSVGQKQLLCLARALMRNNKILVLDQATSNVDMTTDAFIQNVLKKNFANTTVITIAHRLNTVADYDKIIVMHRGKITEWGVPHELIQRRGTFYEMVQHTGKNANLIMAKAKSYYQANTIKKTLNKLI